MLSFGYFNYFDKSCWLLWDLLDMIVACFLALTKKCEKAYSFTVCISYWWKTSAHYTDKLVFSVLSNGTVSTAGLEPKLS